MKLQSAFFSNHHQQNLNLWWQGSCVLAVIFALNLILYMLDQRVLVDEALWLKPLKFEISIIIHYVTLSVLAALLSPTRRDKKSWKAMIYFVVAAGLFETLYILLQAARGRESHFNNATTIESIMYGLMGVGAVILVVGSFYLGFLLFREYQSKCNSILLLASALGLIIGSVLTLIVAGYLSSLPSGYSNDINADTIKMPIFSWYLNGQDLRIPHFFATHMMQFIPLYGLWLSKSDLSIRVAKQRLFIVVGVYSLGVVLLFSLAMHLGSP